MGKEYCFIATKNKGIDQSAEPIKAYALRVNKFAIMSIDEILNLGSLPIFVSFDKRFTTPLLGRDIMNLISMNIDADKNQINMKPSHKATNLLKDNMQIPTQYFIDSNIYNRNKMLLHRFSSDDEENI